MSTVGPQKLRIDVGKVARVSALLLQPPDARACYVFAHGAGAGMDHAFMAEAAAGLAARKIATLRYQFPYMEKAGKRPDPPAIAQAAVRAAVGEAAGACPGLPLFAGGKSFGGRMTSQAQAKAPLAGVRGLVFFGFPLHAAGKPSRERADHLSDVRIPMLFLQGTNDKLAELDLLAPVVAKLGDRAVLHRVESADHSFHVPARSGRNDAAVMAEILDRCAAWIDSMRN
ncbi:MAG: dienelactone hydrolase family protein [Bradyrhizobium sp.]|uniref:alpha/beta hydrolase family protein n=1 Tax=Bradyrhizobium sp. TaxID=376 RepID=UPI001DD344C3|nr:alpha/beta family hydrolase [Bradyrhizobium sp.]MBV9561566.1 dienelactone hydrolase family protein [Bradyrhizobium sp.]